MVCIDISVITQRLLSKKVYPEIVLNKEKCHENTITQTAIYLDWPVIEYPAVQLVSVRYSGRR